MNPDEIRIILRPQWWWPLVAGVLTGLALRAIYSGSPGDLFETMSGSFALLAPIAVSAVSVFVAELRARRSWAYYFWMGALVNLLFVVGTFLVHIEGLICVILAAPLFAIIGGVAGLIAGAAFRWTRWMRRVTYCCALLPIVLGVYEHYVPLPQNVHTIARTIAIAAPRTDVWDQLIATPAIQAEEVQDGLLYRIGVPLPESAFVGELPDHSLVRNIRMGKGIQFDQVSTDWQCYRRVRWRYRFTSQSFPPRALDDHVRIGGKYFDLLDTEYSMLAVGNRMTILRVTMSYRVSTRFNWYAQPIAELFVSNFEETALRFYARRAEAQAAWPSRQRQVVPQAADERRTVDDEHRVVVHHSALRDDVGRNRKRRGAVRLRRLDHSLELELRRAAVQPLDLEQVRARVIPVERVGNVLTWRGKHIDR